MQVDPPIATFYFSDENRDTVDSIADDKGPPVSSHWDTFYYKKNISYVDVLIEIK